jgi:hypothetical protein
MKKKRIKDNNESCYACGKARMNQLKNKESFDKSYFGAIQLKTKKR